MSQKNAIVVPLKRSLKVEVNALVAESRQAEVRYRNLPAWRLLARFRALQTYHDRIEQARGVAGSKP